MKIAVEGCCHGELETIYASMEKIEKKEGYQNRLVICCGDFQAVRNKRDLECMSVPIKYREMGTLQVLQRRVESAVPNFVHRCHEASNYLWELYYGGFGAPNIYYLGHYLMSVGDCA